MNSNALGDGRDVLLSICIPTRDRRRYLEGVLEHLAGLDLPFATEVVVSDHGADGSDGLCRDFEERLNLRYLVRSPAISAFANLYSALRGARGRYAVYLANDDRLFREALIAAVAWLGANPQCSAFYAPSAETNLVDGSRGPITGHSVVPLEFAPHQRLALTEFLLDSQIVPEWGIYRTDCFATLSENPGLYFVYHIMERAIGLGSVRFSPIPFYNSILQHFPGDARPTLGRTVIADIQTWDKYRKGLELLLASGLIGVAPEARPAVLARLTPKLDGFVNQHKYQSFTVLLNGCRFAEALELAKLMIGRGMAVPVDRLLLAQISLAATVDEISRRAIERGCRDGIALYGFASSAIAAAWMSQRPDLPIVELPSLALDNEYLLVAWDHGGVARALAQGWPADRVVDFTRAYAQLDLGPWLDAFQPSALVAG